MVKRERCEDCGAYDGVWRATWGVFLCSDCHNRRWNNHGRPLP